MPVQSWLLAELRESRSGSTLRSVTSCVLGPEDCWVQGQLNDGKKN